jgi:hypothetical protein
MMTSAPRSVAGTLGWSKSGMRQRWRRQPDDDPASQWASPRFVMVSLMPFLENQLEERL